MANIISLQPAGYVASGTYIGEFIRPKVTNITSTNRTPVYIGKGSRLAKVDVSITKGYIWYEDITVSNIPPYRAPLQHNSDGNKQKTEIKDNFGNALRSDQYNFYSIGGIYADAIEINPDIYDNLLQYTISYQSIDLDIADDLPFNQIRTITYVGDIVGNPQYTENLDYYIPVDIGAITDEVFDKTDLEFGPVFRSIGTVPELPTVTAGARPTNLYNRSYMLTFSGKAGTTPNCTIDVNWKAIPVSYGNVTDIDHYSPIYGDPAAATTHKFTINEGSGSTEILELGLSLDFAIWSASTDFENGDILIINGYSGCKVDIDPRYNNSQFSTISSISQTAGTGTAIVSINGDSDYDGSNNEKFKLMYLGAGGPANSHKFGYSNVGYGELKEGYVELPADMNGVIPLDTITKGTFMDDIYFNIDTIAGLVIGDIFEFSATAPRIYMDSKDDRNYFYNITSATYDVPTQNGLIEVTYTTNTPEGSWGTFQVDYANDYGQSILPNNLILWWNNLTAYNDGSTTPNHWTATDNCKQALICSDTIMWDLDYKATETASVDDILTDVTGIITETPNTKYIIINEPALQKPIVSTAIGAIDPATITWSLDKPQYVIFATDPNAILTVKYFYKGNEPVIGSTYWLTANYIRPDEFYNKAIEISSIDIGRSLLAPANTENDLYIMNEIAWSQNSNLQVMYIIQVKDNDSDGVYTDSDYKEAIRVSEDLKATTDIVVLRKPSVIKDLLSANDRANDPFKKAERLGWFGVDSTYAIGDAFTQGTLVYLATNTFQVFGDSPSHGTRILIGSREARTKVVMDSGTEIEVLLDGSFIAGALMAMEGGFTEPAEDLLKKKLYGFTWIETFGDISDRRNLVLGQANILWFIDSGDGIYSIEEDITTDPTDTFNQINNMTQKQWVTKNMRTNLDLTAIGVIANSTEEALGLIKGQILSNLTNYVGKGKIAQYEDNSGGTRNINQGDVIVERDPTKKTTYNFMYRYYLKNVIKHLFGLYVVNTNDFKIGK